MTHPVELHQGQFLHLSRQHPELFSIPSAFTSQAGIEVSVSAPGIIQFDPSGKAQKDIVLSCGVHGNETAPIEILDKIVQEIILGELPLKHRLLVHFGNLAAMDLGERFVTENMNRLFSGAHSTGPGLINPERHRAKTMEESVADFYAKGSGQRIHYDLHTAIRASKNDKFAVYPFLHGKPWKIEQVQFMLACGVNTILLSNGPTTTYSYFSSNQFGADAFTVELGKVRPFGQNNPEDFVDVNRALRELLSQSSVSLPEVGADNVLIYKVHQVINREHEDFSLAFDDETPNFTEFNQGDLLADDNGTLYRATQDGEAIVFPNANVAIGQRALLTVIPTTLERENEVK